MFKADEKLYLVLFVLLVVSLTGLVVWYEVFYDTGDTWPETIKSIGQGIGAAVAVAITILAMLELAMLISERYKAKRFAEGRAEGRGEEWKRWSEWNSRRMAAEARGEKFEEPPPSR